ncbi:MAG: FAD-binding protein [Clostridia bacterium]|nr:FAD-binding protein [Clostridia bacterium]
MKTCGGIAGFPGRILSVPALVVGSGAAGLNAALSLARSMGRASVLLVTEGMNMGTSRNTGSDKQTYYKQATGADFPDSARAMAEDYFACGSMHGDLALTESLGSLRGFFRLVSLGVPFPADRWGEYTGYRTDHDPKSRATSCGPLTSKKMTEALEAAVRREGVPILDGYRAVTVLTEEGRAAGIVCAAEDEITPDNPAGLIAILSGALVWATGGPSSVYAASVYPESQTCALGAPLLAGASASNLTESQYGIASVAFRWNLSGSYQQVLPRYISTGTDGEGREFLPDALGDGPLSLRAQFCKGYEWPFDPSKIGAGPRSSEVDIAVFREIQSGRRVFLDFRANPALIEREGLTAPTIGEEAYEYLVKSRALGDTPVKRLRQMNEKAYRLYLDHGIDLEREPLEIHVAAQHLNGGLTCDAWYESPTLRGLYPVGECGGVFGIRRPGGSALNSTQVGSTRAAEKIAQEGHPAPALSDALASQLIGAAKIASLLAPDGADTAEILEARRREGLRHDACAAFLRSPEKVKDLLRDTARQIDRFTDEERAKDFRALVELLIHRDTLVTRMAMLSAIDAYIADGGRSRGSFLIDGADGLDTAHASSVLETRIRMEDGHISAENEFVPVRPIPRADNWFETVYNAFDTGERFGSPADDAQKQ